MTHVHPKLDLVATRPSQPASSLFRNKHDLRAHLVLSHSFPRWGAVTSGFVDQLKMHDDMHILEAALASKDEKRAVDSDELRIGILGAWYEHPVYDKLTSVELREAAQLAIDYLIFEAPGWNVERVDRV